MCLVHVQERIIVLLWGFHPLCCRYTLLAGRILMATSKLSVCHNAPPALMRSVVDPAWWQVQLYFGIGC